MSTGSPPPPHDPPAGSGASPADPPGGAQPTGPTSYETPGYQPMFDPTARPPEAGRSDPPTDYPQQELLPQDVKPGRSRKPLILVLVVVLALVAGVFVAWRVLRDDGESTRESYCSAIKELAPNDDLLGAITTADSSMFEQAKSLPALAPVAVADDWKAVEDVLAAGSAGQEDLNVSTMLTVIGAIRRIIDDANDNCGTAYTIPGLP